MSGLKTRVAQPFLDFLAFLHREHLFRLMGVIVVLVLGGAYGSTYFQEGQSFCRRALVGHRHLDHGRIRGHLS